MAINYSGLPSRIRRITQRYKHCIESITPVQTGLSLKLKEGYLGRSGGSEYDITDAEDLIYFLKDVKKPRSRHILVALYGFKCPICGSIVQRGSNYIDLDGLRLCNYCGLTDQN